MIILYLYSFQQANNLAAEIDQEQIEIHKFGKDVYTKRFPELETLVVMVSFYLPSHYLNHKQYYKTTGDTMV